MQENDVIKLTIKQKFKVVECKDVKALDPCTSDELKRLSMYTRNFVTIAS